MKARNRNRWRKGVDVIVESAYEMDSKECAGEVEKARGREDGV